jgi:hypothetical protein
VNTHPAGTLKSLSKEIDVKTPIDCIDATEFFELRMRIVTIDSFLVLIA